MADDSISEEEYDSGTRLCGSCCRKVKRSEMLYTKDCNGIPVLLVCQKCYSRIMSGGFHGEYYPDTDDEDAMTGWE